jgi:hypothetical protein
MGWRRVPEPPASRMPFIEDPSPYFTRELNVASRHFFLQLVEAGEKLFLDHFQS